MPLVLAVSIFLLKSLVVGSLFDMEDVRWAFEIDDVPRDWY